MDEILLQLASMSHNGNMMVDQGRRGADERTHIPMLGVQYPRPALQIQNLPLVEVKDKVPMRMQGDRDYKITVDIPVFKGT
ncbi:hypothetical protein ACOSP7_003558 [Xanthoceras sorbifolium]